MEKGVTMCHALFDYMSDYWIEISNKSIILINL